MNQPMNQQPISTRLPPVIVEYDCRGKRVAKLFGSAFQARAFYEAKYKQGRNPTVKKCKNS